MALRMKIGKNQKEKQAVAPERMGAVACLVCVSPRFQPRATSKIIMRVKPKATLMVETLECFPSWDWGISSSTTT